MVTLGHFERDVLSRDFDVLPFLDSNSSREFLLAIIFLEYNDLYLSKLLSSRAAAAR